MKNIISQIIECKAFTNSKKNSVMNKTIKNLILALIPIMMLTFSSCVEDDDYNIPSIEIEEPDITANTTISIVKSMYAGNLVDFDEANNEGELIIEGYVVSNDEAGNLYKVLIIQDAPENPTAAIQLDVDVTSMYAMYKPGRKVYVKLNGLGMDEMNGVLHIGSIEGNTVGRISAVNYDEFIVRSAEVATMVPLVVSPSQFSDSYINMLVQLDDMQLRSEELGQPYANADDTFTVNRYLKSCTDESETIVRNSGFSSFKAQEFPQGRGSIVAIFSKYNSDYQLFIRDTDDVMFDDERCDPVFEETFSAAVDNTELNLPGWTNFAEAGSVTWTEQIYNNNGYAEINPYNSGDASNIIWMITPGIDLDAQDGEVLTFQTEHAYPDTGHDPLEVLISTDFDGTANGVSTATWTALSFDVSYIVDFSTWFNFTNSGPIDISTYTGTAYIAFKYTGSDTSNQNMTLHVDNVKVSVP
jgi:hypothetical protein